MSCWTRVRILYDIELGFPKINNRIIDTEEGFGNLGITQLYRTAIYELKWEKNTILDLGSEGPVDITLKVQYGLSSFCGRQSIEIDDRGQLIIIGNLRDCTRDEFIEALNKFREHLKDFGIFVIAGLVSIQ